MLMLILVLLCENERQRWDASRYIKARSDYLVLILTFYAIPMPLHEVKHFFKQEIIFKQTRVDFFTSKIWRHLSITSQLR